MAQTGEGGFVFPAEHGFPPFYTLQPNVQTAIAQIEMWGRLVLAYCAAHDHFVLEATGTWERSSALFCNADIDRALSPHMIRIVMAHLVQQGHAMYHPPLPRGVKPPQAQASRNTHALSAAGATAAPALTSAADAACNQVLLLWRSPEAWGDSLYEWNKSILTMHELATGAFVERAKMPQVLLRLALQTQMKKGRAQVFSVTADRWSALLPTTDVLAQASDETMGELGVKFV